MAKEQINLKELEKMIISEAERIMSLGDPFEVEMNKMTNPGNSDGDSLVSIKEKGGFVKKSAAPEKAKNIEDSEEALEIDMNDSEDQGHDEEISAAVKVDATSSTKNGESTKGQHNADFDSKKSNPSVKSSEPFEDRKEKVEMNSQDKAVGDGAKVYAEAGAELNNGASTGQHKASFSEKAKNEKETAERIAQGIQLPESFKNKAELLSFINEEAKKISSLLESGTTSYWLNLYINGKQVLGSDSSQKLGDSSPSDKLVKNKIKILIPSAKYHSNKNTESIEVRVQKVDGREKKDIKTIDIYDEVMG